MSEVISRANYRMLGETCRIMAGYGFPESLQGQSSGDLPFFKVGDISEAWKRGDTFLSAANHYISCDQANRIRAKPLPAHTTVFAKIGAAIALNRRALLAQPSLVDNNVMGLLPASPDLDYKYLYHFVCTLKLGELSRATTVPSVRKSDIEQIPIPVPSISDQKRAVAEIEKQFTRLDAGVAAVRRVQANLKRYRAAVLKAACEGRLVPTEAELAKAEGRTFETGEQLLARILTDRRKNWRGRGKYKEPVAPDNTNLPLLPEGWTWANLGQLASVDWGNTSITKASYVERGYPAFSAAGCDGLLAAAERSGPAVILSAIGARCGKCFFAEGEWTAIKNTIVIQSKCTLVNHKFLLHYLNDASHWEISGSGQPFIKLGTARVNPIPFPPLAEQTRIVAEVERRLSVIEELEAAVTVNLQRASRLRQSILQRSFPVSERLLHLARSSP